MSTRVFKPISLTEIPKIKLSPSVLDGRLAYKGIPRVRRSLFKPDPQETQRFLKEEFSKQAAKDCDKWDFDFVGGKPRNTSRYEWTAVNARPQLDVMMRPIKRFLHIDNNYTEDLYPPILSLEEDENMMTEIHDSNKEIAKKQSLITDFMQVRKRIEERPLKKMESGSITRPQKKARLSLVDSAS